MQCKGWKAAHGAAQLIQRQMSTAFTHLTNAPASGALGGSITQGR